MTLRLSFGAAILLLLACQPADPLSISDRPLVDGQFGQPYADTILTSGGDEDIRIYVLGGQLPPGVGLRQVDRYAVLDGTPSLAGQYLFTIEAQEVEEDTLYGGGEITSRGFVITVNP